MQLGKNSIAGDAEEEDIEVSETHCLQPKKGKGVEKTKDDVDPSGDKFVTELLDMVGGSQKRGLGIVAGGVLFSLLLGMWAMGAFTTRVPDLDPPVGSMKKVGGIMVKKVKKQSPPVSVEAPHYAPSENKDAQLEEQAGDYTFEDADPEQRAAEAEFQGQFGWQQEAEDAEFEQQVKDEDANYAPLEEDEDEEEEAAAWMPKNTASEDESEENNEGYGTNDEDDTGN